MLLNKKIHIVLSHTSHPGNIGSAARAMKTMNLKNLALVNPKKFPHDEALMLASGADDVVEQAKVFASVDAAIANCRLVVGTSARDRSLSWPMLDPKECAEKIIQEAGNGEVAILFGREHAGLTNEELQKCHYHVQIPANPEYSSLNLAQAVQVICYEINMVLQKNTDSNSNTAVEIPRYATIKELEHYFNKLEETLELIDFISSENPNRIMQRLRRLYQRIRLEPEELSILYGILTETRRKLNG